LLAWPEDGWMYELVEGRLVRMPSCGGEASLVAGNLLAEVVLFLRTHKLGRATGSDGTYNLTQPDDTEETALVPDVAFVRADRVPARTSPEFAKAWRLAPDLVAEVVSPSQYRPEMAAKAKRYLEAGVRLVWIVWPKYQQVDVWRTGADQPIATLKLGDALDGLDVLPGFSYALSDLFE
ncbi:MAG: Uma2 family endonuclease, partial [Ktedonobacterales bacterium]